LLALGFSLLPGWGLLKLEKRTVDLSLTACGAGAFLFSLLYLIGANYGSTQLSQMSEFGPAFGAYLSLVAGAVVGISGMLSQKDSSKNEAAN
jgi:hypothetical protein